MSLPLTSLPLSRLAELIGAELEGDGALVVEGLSTLSEAGPREVTFLANERYRPQLATTRAVAVVVRRDEPRGACGAALLRVADPNRAFTQVIKAFAPTFDRPAPGVHASATVHPTAEVHATASVGPQCVVEAQARIGAGAVLRAQVFVGAHAVVGNDCFVQPLVTIYERVVLGARVVVHAGTVLGAEGFGWEPTRAGWDKIPQCGTVIVEEDVEIGANCAVDRARFGATRICKGAKLDNLVHVAHNVVVGPNALLVAQVGIAGSSKIGERAILAGQVGVGGHATIGAGARVGGQAGVFGDVPAGEDWAGWPARPKAQTMRSAALVARLPELSARLKALEQEVAHLRHLTKDAP